MIVTIERLDKRSEYAIATIGNGQHIEPRIGHNIAPAKTKGLSNLTRRERSLEFIES
jgi:hypothetical protein